MCWLTRLDELLLQFPPLGRFVSPIFVFVDRIARDDFAIILDQFFDGFWRSFEGQLILRFEVHISNVSLDWNSFASNEKAFTLAGWNKWQYLG